MDESCKQLVENYRNPLPRKPGSAEKIDDEYIRKGAAQIFLAVEPLTRKMFIHICKTRTMIDWANFMKSVIDSYPEAIKIRLVMDNLNTHTIASFYEAFSPEVAHYYASRIEIHYTPKHGSWLNISEMELSCYKRSCLKERMGSLEEMQQATNAWLSTRTANKIKWQFDTKEARVKLRSLYPAYSNGTN